MFAASKAYLDAIRRPVPEPWMFGVEVTVDGRPVPPPQIGRFTLLGHARMAWRRRLGRPALNGVPLKEI